jgi:hypothetical protein
VKGGQNREHKKMQEDGPQQPHRQHESNNRRQVLQQQKKLQCAAIASTRSDAGDAQSTQHAQ